MAQAMSSFSMRLLFTAALAAGCSSVVGCCPECAHQCQDAGIDSADDGSPGDSDTIDHDAETFDHCTDGILNADEVDVDCGGNDCPPCDVDDECLTDDDCESGTCRDGICERLAGRLDVSDDRRYLVDHDGQPVYLLGGTAWTMPENATREDAVDYMDNRKSRGFNYFQVVAVRHLDVEPLDSTISTRTMNPVNMYGHRPFEENADHRADPSLPITVEGGTPTSPNDYWDHLEFIIANARDRGMYIGVLPTWGIYYINNNNPGLRLFTESSAKIYGRFLGERFREYPNIIWILGGDTEPDRYADGLPIYRAMAEGLVEGVTGETPSHDEDHPAWGEVMITYHGRRSSAAYFNDDAWLRLNMVYEGDPELLPNIETYYANTPTRPMLVGESFYEGWTWNGAHKTTRLVRRQMHHVFLGGALGGTAYGSAMSAAGANDQLFRFQPGWRDRLDLEGASDVVHLKTLLDEHDWWRWVPDRRLIRSGQGSGETTKAAVRSADGTEILVYYADVSVASIDVSTVTSHDRVRVTWHDPRNGDRLSGGVLEGSQTIDFCPPRDWEDAVLILEGTDDPLEDLLILVTEFRTIDGEVVLAAESYSFSGGSGGDRGTWSLDTAEDGYLGFGYMRSSLEQPADGSHLRFHADAANLNYAIDFDRAGTYYVHIRTLAMDHTENGFFATLDGEEINYGGVNPEDPSRTAYYIFVQSSGRWNWYTDGGGAETRGLRARFTVGSPGRHTFAVYRRDTGSRIDHIWLTTSDVVPEAASSLDLPDPSLFIIDER